MHRFLSDEPLVNGASVTLSAEESHHLARVVRLAEGETIALIDGRGALAKATLVSASAKGAVAEVISVEHSAKRPRISVCFGVPKGPALDFIVRRCTELGVAAFQPLVTRYSLHLKEKDFNESRWTKVVAEVAKQCEELHFPEILPAKPFQTWLASRPAGRALVFCDEAARDAASSLSADTPACDLVIGAEGGWSDEERELVRAAGGVFFGLGRNRLRAETAALVAVTLLKERLGELG